MDIILNCSNGYNKNFHLKKYHVSSLLCLPQGLKTYVVLIKKNSLFEHEIALELALKIILDKNFFYMISFLLYLGHFNPISIFNFKNFLWWKHLPYIYLSIHLSIHTSFYLYIYLFINLSIHKSMYSEIYLSIHQSILTSIYP